MMLAMAFADVPFGNKEAWQDFLFRHSEEHKRIAASISSKYGKQIDAVVFADEGDMKNWLMENSAAHGQEMQVLGIEAINLSDVDLSNEQAYNDWMAQHAMLHQMTQQALGL